MKNKFGSCPRNSCTLAETAVGKTLSKALLLLAAIGLFGLGAAARMIYDGHTAARAGAAGSTGHDNSQIINQAHVTQTSVTSTSSHPGAQHKHKEKLRREENEKNVAGDLKNDSKNEQHQIIDIPARAEDDSPYITGTIRLDNADAGRAVQLLSEAAGGASIIVEQKVLEQSIQSAQSGAGISLTLSNISLADALDALAAANGWAVLDMHGSHLVVSRETLNRGLDVLPAATAYDVSSEKLEITIYRPRSMDACSLEKYAHQAAPDSDCNADLNLLILKGRPGDIDRAKRILDQVDSPEDPDSSP